MGLQLINVLRDAGTDLRTGRCYFPEDELRAVGLSATADFVSIGSFQPIYQRWMEKAQDGLEGGMQYSRAIRNRRVRAATVYRRILHAALQSHPAPFQSIFVDRLENDPIETKLRRTQTTARSSSSGNNIDRFADQYGVAQDVDQLKSHAYSTKDKHFRRD